MRDRATSVSAPLLQGALIARLSASLHLCDTRSSFPISQVWFFNVESKLVGQAELAQDVEADFFSKLALAAQVVVFARKEDISCEHLAIVTRGLIARNGVIGQKCIGEDMIVSDQSIRDMSSATALTSLVQVSRVNRDDLIDLLPLFPCARKCIRKAAIRITFQMTIVRMASFAKEGQSQRGGRGLSLFEVFKNFRQHGDRDRTLNFEGRTKMERRVDQLEEKLDGLSTSIDDKFGALMAAVQGAHASSSASRSSKLQRVPTSARCDKQASATPVKSSPPPRERRESVEAQEQGSVGAQHSTPVDAAAAPQPQTDTDPDQAGASPWGGDNLAA